MSTKSVLDFPDFRATGFRTDVPTCLVDVLFAGVPDAGVEAAEEEAVIPSLPAIVHLALIGLVYAVVDAVVVPLLAAVGFGDTLSALAPVRGDECGGGEEQGHQVQTHRQQSATFPRRFHDLGESGRVPAGGEKVHPRRREAGGGQRRRGMARQRRTEELRARLFLFSPLCDSLSSERQEVTGGPASRREKRKLEIRNIFFHLLQHH